MINYQRTEDPILLDILKLLTSHLPVGEGSAPHCTKIRAGSKELRMVAKSYVHHDRHVAAFYLYPPDDDRSGVEHYTFLLTQEGWHFRLSELLTEEFGVILDLQQLTPDGETLGNALHGISNFWLTERDILCLVFNRLSAALPGFEWGDYGSLNYEGQGYGIRLDQIQCRDAIDLAVWRLRPRFSGKYRFALADPKCFNKLAAVLAEYDITLDVEALT